MITLVTGGSKCGKSSYAENLLSNFNGKKIYIATMQPFGTESLSAIARHRKMRNGKGFETIEKYTDIHEISLPKNCGVLLECMGNLCANEMFESNLNDPCDKIISGILNLKCYSSELVIVTNDIFRDGFQYSCETMRYIQNIGKINCKIAEFADNVIECVYGIPLALKGNVYD